MVTSSLSAATVVPGATPALHVTLLRLLRVLHAPCREWQAELPDGEQVLAAAADVSALDLKRVLLEVRRPKRSGRSQRRSSRGGECVVRFAHVLLSFGLSRVLLRVPLVNVTASPRWSRFGCRSNQH